MSRQVLSEEVGNVWIRNRRDNSTGLLDSLADKQALKRREESHHSDLYDEVSTLRKHSHQGQAGTTVQVRRLRLEIVIPG